MATTATATTLVFSPRPLSRDTGSASTSRCSFSSGFASPSLSRHPQFKDKDRLHPRMDMASGRISISTLVRHRSHRKHLSRQHLETPSLSGSATCPSDSSILHRPASFSCSDILNSETVRRLNTHCDHFFSLFNLHPQREQSAPFTEDNAVVTAPRFPARAGSVLRIHAPF